MLKTMQKQSIINKKRLKLQEESILLLNMKKTYQKEVLQNI